MSASVDERIVQMQFDNAQFEQKAQNTITTLSSLNEALKLPTGNSGFEKIQNSSNKIDFSKLNEAIELVNYRFSNLGIIATNVLNRITNAAIDTGRRLAEAITIQPIKDGFSEYEEKMDSVKRILNSAKDSEGLPVTLDVVNQKLDELNHYSDKTIYSFRDMTQNIGKFTNAGVDLDTSVLAIQGIANEAALAGANAQEASRAMYNFAQALSVGYIQKVDWRSIELANMATVGFKEALVDTAVKLETVKKVGDEYVTTTTNMNGKTSEAMGSMELFSNGLSYQWLTADVLIETLKRYSNEEDELGKAAFEAATEVATFSKLLETLKEAMGSGWAQTWQLIIGDYGEAKELWTGVNNVLSEMINTSADTRNKLISDWEALGGRKFLIEGLTELWGGLVNIGREVGWAFKSVMEEIDGFDLVNISLGIRNFGKSFREFTGKHGADINGIAQGIASAFDLMSQTFSAIGRTVAPLLQPLGDLFGLILRNSGIAGRSFTEFVKSLKDNDTIYNGLQSVIAILQKVYDFAGRAVSAVLKLFGIDTGFDSSINPIQAFVNAISSIGENPYVIKAADVIDRVRDALANFVDNIKSSAALQNVTDVLGRVGTVLSNVGKVLGSGVLFLVKSAGKLIGDLFGTLKTASPDNLLNVFSAGSVATVIMGVKKMFEGLQTPSGGIKGFLDFIKGLGGIGDKIGSSFSKFIEAITSPLKTLQESLKADILIKIAKAIAILVGSIFVMSTIDPGRLTMAVFGIAGLMTELADMLNALSTLISDSDAAKLKSLGPTMAMLSVAIGILALAAKALGGMDPGQLLSGVVAVGFLVIIMTRMKEIGNEEINTKGLISMSVAIGILALVTRFLGGMDPGQLLNGVLAVGALVIIMLRIQELADKQINSKGLISMSIAIGILGVIAKLLGSVEPDKLITGILAVGTLMELMKRLASANQNINIKGFLSLSLAVGVLALAAKMLGKMDPDRLISGVLAVSALMEVMGHVASNAKGDLKTAASIAIMAVAMNALIPVVTLLGALPFEKVAQGVASLALVLGILIVAGGAAQGIVVPLLGLAGAITLIGVGVGALGAGLLMASVALTAFGASLVASGASIVATIGILIQGIIGLIPLILTAIVNGILQILRLIGNSAQTIVDVVVQIGLAVINGLRDLFVPLGTLIMDIVVFLLQLLTEYMPTITNALVELTIQVIDGVAASIYDNTDRIIAAVHHLMLAIIDLALACLQEILRGIPGVGSKIDEEIGKVRDSMREDFDKNYSTKLGADYTQGLADGTHSKSGELQAAGTEAGTSIKDGLLGGFSELPDSVSGMFGDQIPESIRNSIPGAQGAATELGDGTQTSLLESWSGLGDTGLYLDQGLADGITENGYLATEASGLLGQDVLSQLNTNMEINSPSQATWNSGMYLDQGLANGITDNQGFVTTAITTLGSAIAGAFSTLTNTFSAIGRTVSSAFGRGVASGSVAARASGSVLGSSAASGVGSARGAFSQNGTISATNYTTAIRYKQGESRIAGSLVGSSAVSGLGTARPAFSSAGMSSGASYATGVASKKGSARSAGQDVGSSAVQGMKSVNGFYDAGRDSGEGYIDGLWSKAREMANAAAEVVRNALRAAKDAIDSDSPSKKYMKLGADSDRGYILGVEGEAKNVNRAMDTLATNAMGAFYEGISRADMLANSDFLVTPTIAPVMDMTSIYGTADYLGNMFTGAGGVLGTISTDINNNTTDINSLVETTGRILTVLRSARPITIDGTTVIGWIDRELGALE